MIMIYYTNLKLVGLADGKCTGEVKLGQKEEDAAKEGSAGHIAYDGEVDAVMTGMEVSEAAKSILGKQMVEMELIKSII